MLTYQHKQEIDHQQILTSIDKVPDETLRKLRDVKQSEQEEQNKEQSQSGWINPFSVVAADDLDLDNPEHIKKIRNLFITHTDLSTIRKRFNTVLEGQRGTGKTMIMKYLAFETQILELSEDPAKDSKEFFTTSHNFIGIYSKLEQGVFDKSDFEAIEDETRREQVFEHRLVLKMFYDILQTTHHVFECATPATPQVRRLKQAFKSYLGADDSNDSIDHCGDDWTELIQVAQDEISLTECPN